MTARPGVVPRPRPHRGAAMTFIEAMEQAAQALESIGAVVLLAGLFVSAALAVRDYLRARDATSAYRVLRQVRNSGATLLSTNLSHDQEAKLPEAFVEVEQGVACRADRRWTGLDPPSPHPPRGMPPTQLVHEGRHTRLERPHDDSTAPRRPGPPSPFSDEGHAMTRTSTTRRRHLSHPPPELTRERRIARGKAARAEGPRESHTEFTAGPDRTDPLSLLEGQAVTRVPELLPIRYGRMASSAFAFFRGAALPMASDLARTPRSGLTVQACGDAHLANFGVFASPERNLVFDINDFDETLPGPWEWDVKRLATSLEIAGRSRDYPTKTRRGIVHAAVAAYRRAMRAFAHMDALAVWYSHADMARIEAVTSVSLRGHQRKALAHTMDKARAKDNLGALGRFAAVHDGVARLRAGPPLVVPIRDLLADPAVGEALEEALRQIIRAYEETLEPERRVLLDRYRLVDMARKVVGVGSVGTRSWMFLMLEDGSSPLFLQAKEAGPSVMEAFVGASEYENSGQRVVVGQRLMQAVSDIFLGWVRVQGLDGEQRDFYVRQLRDWKGSAEIETMLPDGMLAYGEVCGWTLARAHARSGDRIAMAAYLGSSSAFDVAIREFAESYADQNE